MWASTKLKRGDEHYRKHAASALQPSSHDPSVSRQTAAAFTPHCLRSGVFTHFMTERQKEVTHYKIICGTQDSLRLTANTTPEKGSIVASMGVTEEHAIRDAGADLQRETKQEENLRQGMDWDVSVTREKYLRWIKRCLLSLNRVFLCVLSERRDAQISEGGGGEDAEGHHSILFPRGHQLGSSDWIPQVHLEPVPALLSIW